MDYVTRQFINLAKKLRDDVRKSFSSLHTDLSRLSNGLKNLKDAVGAERQSDEKQGAIDHRITVADLQTQVPIRVQTEAKHSKIARVWGVAKGALEIAGILAAIIYAWTAYHQWQETIDATNFAARQTELSRKALNETTKQFRTDQRPYLIGKTPNFSGTTLSPNSSIHINLTIKNIGKTPALKEFTYVRLFPYRAPEGASAATQRSTVRRMLAHQMRKLREGEHLYRSTAAAIPEDEADLAPGDENFTSNFAKDPGDEVILSADEFTRLTKPDKNDIVLFVIGLSCSAPLRTGHMGPCLK